MAGETSGPSEQEIRMVTLERKFDELLNFVQLMVRRNLDDEDQRKEDNKNTNDKEPKGHPHANTTANTSKVANIIEAGRERLLVGQQN